MAAAMTDLQRAFDSRPARSGDQGAGAGARARRRGSLFEQQGATAYAVTTRGTEISMLGQLDYLWSDGRQHQQC